MIIDLRFYVCILFCSFSSETLFASVYKLMLTNVKVSKCNRGEIGCFGYFFAHKKRKRTRVAFDDVVSSNCLSAKRGVNSGVAAFFCRSLSLFRVCGVVCTTQLYTLLDDVSRELKRKKKVLPPSPFPPVKKKDKEKCNASGVPVSWCVAYVITATVYMCHVCTISVTFYALNRLSCSTPEHWS